MKTIKKQVFLTVMGLFIGLGAFAQDITGTWKGTLSVQGAEMPLIFNVSNEDGTISSTMDSPSQGATDIPMDETTFADNTLTIVFKQAGIKYVGTLEADKVSGTFYQGGMEFPLNLEKNCKDHSRKSRTTKLRRRVNFFGCFR